MKRPHYFAHALVYFAFLQSGISLGWGLANGSNVIWLAHFVCSLVGIVSVIAPWLAWLTRLRKQSDGTLAPGMLVRFAAPRAEGGLVEAQGVVLHRPLLTCAPTFKHPWLVTCGTDRWLVKCDDGEVAEVLNAFLVPIDAISQLGALAPKHRS